MIDWNDLRYFLAVVREGSTLSAARVLRTSQTTVARRINALEQAVGYPLFDRRQAGYSLTSDGEQLVATAEAVAAAAEQFEENASAKGREHRGTVKVTTEEVYAVTLIAPLLGRLRERYPDIMIELDTSQEVRDLGAGEADISLRSTKAVEQPAGIVGRRLCDDHWTLYCSRDYGERNGVPSSIAELRKHPFIGGGGGNLWVHYETWLRALGLEDQVAVHHATSGGLLSGVRSGFGIVALPCIVGDADPELIRCLPPVPDHGRVLWLLTHDRVRKSPRVRGVIDFLYENISAQVRRLEMIEANAA